MRRFIVLTVAIGITAIALGVWALGAGGRRAVDQPESDAAFSTLETIDFDTATTGLAADRPLYRYSVIPGGVYSANDLRNAIQNDPVVAAHYQNLDQSKLQVRTVAHDQYAYVSYRKGDEVRWTRNKVLLRQGETIITDGTKQVRAKCGNCISLEPQLPTAADEPDVVEFDRLVDPIVPASEGRPEVALVQPASPVVSRAAPAAAPAAAAPAAPAPEPLAAGRFAGGSSSPLAAGTRGPGDTPDVSVPPVDLPGPQAPLPPGFFPQPPGVVPTPPDDLLPPSDNPPLDKPPTWEPPTDLPPRDPVPVPEPGTLLLMGGGALAALVRRLRARSR